MLKRIRNTLSNFNSKISSLVEKHQLFSVSKNNIKHYLLAVLILAIVIITISSSLAATVPVKSIEIKSENLNYDNKEQGAWKVTKSAYWTAKNKARITFDVDTIEKIPDENRRIILVLDCSEAMNGVDFQKLINNLRSVLEKMSNDKKTNTMAYVEFNDTATTKVDYTTSMYDIKSKVRDATVSGGSNYYAALQQVDSLLKNYTHVDTENVSVIFITSGSPNVDTPNEVSQYAYLKEQYPYLEIKAIQYEIGDEVLDSVKNISDKQYIAKEDNTEKILYNTIFGVMEYDDFSISDQINTNYFDIESVSTEDGEALINGNNINWNITNSRFTTGTKKQLNIDIELKDDITTNVTDLYETNIEEAIVSKLGDIEENITSTLTPILSAGYTVTYDINSPPECTPSYSPVDEKHFVFDSVNFPTEVPTCFGYQFKNWEIMNDNVTSTNNNEFIMPEENVNVKALWTKLSLNKSNTGKVTEKATLYNVIKYEAMSSSGLAKEYTGNHQDSMTGIGNKKIYYYHADTDEEGKTITNSKNNVLFAGKCWQMIRTTDTGGVKMIYNGVPGDDGNCLEPGITPGYIGTTTATIDDISNEYYYGTDYEYDATSQTYKLSGELFHTALSLDNEKLIGKYTCRKENIDDSCDYLAYVIGKWGFLEMPISIYMYIGPTQSNDIGKSLYNHIDMSVGNTSISTYISSIGYMYNPSYPSTSFLSVSEKVLDTTSVLTGIYYSSSYTSSSDKYRLRLPSKVSSSSDVSKMNGKYTLKSLLLLGTNEKMYYVIAAESTDKIYCIEMTYPNDLNYYNYTYAYGDSYTENSDGTYTINNATTIKRIEWYDNYTKIKNKYICKLNDQSNCDTVHYVTSTTKEKYNGLAVAGVAKHSSSYTYENGVYKLSDDATTKWDIIENETTNLDNMHYACYSEINENNECEKLIYIYNFNGTTVSGIVLENGKDIETAKKEIFDSEFVNSKDSVVKMAIDSWYKKELLNYTDYLEDVIYCGNRNITDFAGWNPSGGKIKNPLKFKEYTLSEDLSCQKTIDKFSLSNPQAKLKYPIGLPTGNEINLLGNKYVTNQTAAYYLMSPTEISDVPYIRAINEEGENTEIPSSLSFLEFGYGVRPVISLKPNTKYSKGDGSYLNPYVVDMSE